MEEREDNSPQVAAAEEPGGELPSERRRRSRQVLLLLVAVAAGAAGFWYSLHRSRPAGPAEGIAEQPAERSQDPPYSLPLEITPGASADSLPDPASPRPGTPEAMIEEVNQVADQLVARFPDDPDALEITARAQFRFGNSEEAVRAWEKCLEVNPGYAHALHGMGLVAAKKGEYQKAVSLFRRALVIAPNLAETQVQLADALVNLGKTGEAILVLEAVVKNDSRSPVPFVLLGMAYLQQKGYQKAKENYEAAIALHPQHANARFGLATACARLGLEDESAKHMAVFGKLRSEETEIRKLERNQYDDLDTMYEDAAQLYIEAGRVFVGNGDPSAAERVWQRAAALRPRNVNCRQALAWFYLQQNKIPQTIQVLVQLSEIEPANLSYPLEIARLHAQTDRFEAAEDTLKRVCERAPQGAAGFLALAQLYVQTDRKLDEALVLAQTAVRLQPNAANHVFLSQVCQRTDDRAGAIAAMEQAVELDRDNVRYRQMLELLREEK